MTLTTRRVAVIALACSASMASLAFAQANKGEIRIAHVHSLTGPLDGKITGQTTLRQSGAATWSTVAP